MTSIATRMTFPLNWSFNGWRLGALGFLTAAKMMLTSGFEASCSTRPSPIPRLATINKGSVSHLSRIEFVQWFDVKVPFVSMIISTWGQSLPIFILFQFRIQVPSLKQFVTIVWDKTRRGTDQSRSANPGPPGNLEALRRRVNPLARRVPRMD